MFSVHAHRQCDQILVAINGSVKVVVDNAINRQELTLNDNREAGAITTNDPDDWNQRRAIIARKYFERLSDSTSIRLPEVPAWADAVWHLFVVQCDHRDTVREKLAAANIGTLIHYPIPPHLSKAYKHLSFRPVIFRSPSGLPVRC